MQIQGKTGAERVLQKLMNSIESGNYYEAHQMYRTLYFRYMGQQKYEEIRNLLYDGSLLLFQHQQLSSGADLAKLFVEMLNKSKMRMRREIVCQLADLMAHIPPAAPERQSFLMGALNWSQVENPESKKFEGHPSLHQEIGDVYWREGNYHMAKYHYLRSNDMRKLGSMLVEAQVEMGYLSEIDLFVTQVVLQLLCIRNAAIANALFDSYLERHPLLSRSPPFKFPLLNFTRMLLLTLERKLVSSYTVLCEFYQPCLMRDPSNREYLDRVGQIYFGMPPPRTGSLSNQGIFGDLIQSLIGNMEADSDNDETSSTSLLPSELD